MISRQNKSPEFTNSSNKELPCQPKSYSHDAVLIVVGDASETVDTLYPLLRVQEEGIQAVVVGPEARRYQMVLHEIPETGWDITQETTGYSIRADLAFADVNPADFLGIYLSGGRAPEYIRYDEHLLAMTRYFVEKGKPVASVCHGAEILCAAGVIQGRRLATVPKCRFDVEICGGVFVNEPCVIDRNIVSGRTWHDHGRYMKYWVEMVLEERNLRQAVAA